jgi:O-antigen/teichoic acid export membrane protein
MVTRILGSAELGRVVAANAVMQVLFVVAGAGLRPAVQRRYAEPGGESDASRLLSLAVASAALLTVVADVTGPFWSVHVGFDSYSGPVRLAVLWAGISAVTDSCLALLRSQDRLPAFSSVSLLQSVVAEATSLILVHQVQASATMFLLGQLSVQIVAAGLGLTLVPPRGLRPGDGRLVVSALTYGVPLIPAVLCTFVLDTADRLIIQNELGPGEVARYHVAYNIGALPTLLVGLLSATWLPRTFAVAAGRERAAVLAASRDVLFGLLAPVVLGLSAVAPLVLRLWAPASYRVEGLLAVNAVVVISVLPYAAGLVSTRALMAEGRTGAVAVAQAVAAVANVALNLVLIPRYGLLGSAAATCAAYLLLHAILRQFAGSLVPGRPPASLLVRSGTAALGAMVAVVVPSSGVALAGRCAVVLLSLVWFGRLVRSATRTDERPGGRHARARRPAARPASGASSGRGPGVPPLRRQDQRCGVRADGAFAAAAGQPAAPNPHQPLQLVPGGGRGARAS